MEVQKSPNFVTLKARSLMVVLAFLCSCSAIQSTGEETRLAGSSQPPDTSPHYRPSIPEDLAVARRNRPAVLLQAPGPNFNLAKLIDVGEATSSCGAGTSCTEPSIAVNPENPNIIVIHAGFHDWDSTGQNNARLFVSTNGGTTWSSKDAIDRPTNISVETGPNDTTLAYGANSLLAGTFLVQRKSIGPPIGNDVFTGSTGDPTKSASFQWHTIIPGGGNAPPGQLDALRNDDGVTNGVVRAQQTDQISTHDNDQPWVVVHSHLPDHIIMGEQSDNNRPLPIASARGVQGGDIAMQNDVYVAYSDRHLDTIPHCNGSVPVRVAASPAGAHPPNFTVDKQVGASLIGGCMGPGIRLAVAPRTVFRDGTVGLGFIYSVHQSQVSSPSNPDDPRLIDIVLNRTTDRGANWNVNGDPKGMVVDHTSSQQPTPKFGMRNALFGGIDHLAVDPSNGVVYVAYGVFDEEARHNRLAIRQLFYAKCDEFSSCNVLVAGPRVFVNDGLFPAALPAVAVAANGTVGVLYDTFDGMDNGIPVFTAHLALADARHGDLTFTTHFLLTFLSPDIDRGPGQRVLGDFQQMVAVGNKFYGVFTGNGAALGRSVASSDPIFFVVDVSSPGPIAIAPAHQH
jgi:hypothetical protein